VQLDIDQQEALEMIETATGVVRLLGGPGVGKTTTINEVRGGVVRIAPTNKAATLIGGQTVHKFLHLVVKRKKGKMVTVPTLQTPRFPIPQRVILDEASCLPRDIMNKYVLPLIPKLVLVGDEAQLNPVGEKTIPFMDVDCPTKTLDYVHRFGGELLEVAYEMRKSVFDPSHDFAVPMHWNMDQDELLHSLTDNDCIVAWRNKSVNHFNRLVRMHKFGATDWHVGEKVRVGTYYLKDHLPTESEYFITGLSVQKQGLYDTWMIELDNGKCVPVIHDDCKEDFDDRCEAFVQAQNWRAFYALTDSYCDLRPSYAITAHKAQGSTYKNSFVCYGDIFENPTSNEAIRAAYVATTRAQKTARNITF